VTDVEKGEMKARKTCGKLTECPACCEPVRCEREASKHEVCSGLCEKYRHGVQWMPSAKQSRKG
jgi:hypothetical protein